MIQHSKSYTKFICLFFGTSKKKLHYGHLLVPVQVSDFAIFSPLIGRFTCLGESFKD